MKTQIRFTCAVLALAIFALGFIACEPGTAEYVVGTEANMTGVQINSVNVTVAPLPIESLEYDDEDFNLFDAPQITAPLNRNTDTVSVRFRPRVSHGARTEWGIGSIDMRPFDYYDLRVPATFDGDDYIYFKVMSEDGEITQYYRYYIWVRSPVTELADLYIGTYDEEQSFDEDGEPILNNAGDPVYVITRDDRMWAEISTPGSAYNQTGPGVLSIKLSQAQGADIIAVPNDSTSTLRYALTNSSNAAPNFGTSNRFNLTDYYYLYVEITAQNTVDKAIYRFRVEVDRIATIKSLTFKDASSSPNKEYAVAGLGTPRASWNSVGVGNHKTADMPGAGFGLTIVGDDDRANFQYALIANKNAAESTASFSTVGPSANALFNGTNVLVIKGTSGNGQGVRYYKIEVELLAANFSEQPKSNYYYYFDTNAKAPNGTDDLYAHIKVTPRPTASDAAFTGAHGGQSSVQPLTVTLDRSGSFTYQWWHANSWYGGYGFDADGRVGYTQPNPDTGVNEQIWQNGFVEDGWHRKNLDEKGNTSLFNGGNWFVYEVPGKPITGATGATYTPQINEKPFLGDFTSATHYYWVVVTDTTTNRKATSKRAAIITEWDPKKKHHIIDLDRDLWETVDGNKVVYSARNPKVFTYHREKYTFPIQLPSTFDVDDYTVATAQALFFLKDGTPWVQNWTQGDIGFEDDTKSNIVLYYNLTNNNATLGLVGGGKEPSGGTLDKAPSYVTVKPAGEKPPSAMPSSILPASLLDENGMPRQRPSGSAGGAQQGDAQGWFTGFIEIVELHFEGPARTP